MDQLATTPDDVRAWLVAFFLELPNTPVFAAARGEARFLDQDKSPSSFVGRALQPRCSAREAGSGYGC